jgi:hypothetical protein
LPLNPESCRRFQKEVQYLARVVSPEGISTDHENVKGVQEWPTPQNKHETRSFLGLYKTTNKIHRMQSVSTVHSTNRGCFHKLKGALCTALVCLL